MTFSMNTFTFSSIRIASKCSWSVSASIIKIYVLPKENKKKRFDE
jgi:hypothetical protein